MEMGFDDRRSGKIFFIKSGKTEPEPFFTAPITDQNIIRNAAAQNGVHVEGMEMNTDRRGAGTLLKFAMGLSGLIVIWVLFAH